MTKTKTLMLLAASTLLTTGFGLPSWSALHAATSDTSLAPLTALPGSEELQRPLILADNDEDEDDDEGGSVKHRASDDDDEGECEDDDGNCAAAAAAPAPAGSVPPPENGLFDNSTAPKATVK